MKEETRKRIHELKEEQKAGGWKGREKELLKTIWNLKTRGKNEK